MKFIDPELTILLYSKADLLTTSLDDGHQTNVPEEIPVPSP